MLSILAQAEAAGLSTYFSLTKIISILVIFVLWALACQWVDRDADRVKTRRELWNMIVLGVGMSGAAVLFLIPWSGAAFFLGLAFWMVLSWGPVMAYVVHRNGRVVPARRVMTPAHFKQLFSGKGKTKERQDKGIRVVLQDGERNQIKRSSEPEEQSQFETVQEFLFDGLWKRASDIDVLLGAEKARVVYKIDGLAIEQPNGLAVEDANRLLCYMKRVAGLNEEERRRPQVGRIHAGLLGSEEKPAVMEVHTSGSTAGERLRLKLNRSAGLMRLEDLGFAEERIKKLKEVAELDAGLVLFAGPKEAGLTTTQYAVLRTHDAYIQNIYALETKPLLQLDNISQQVFDPSNAEISFARMLQTVLRREPDVVMVSQCEDRETAQLACRAATDKKIYMAIRAANCFDALARLLALAEDANLVAGSTVAIVGQRLLRVLCSACREAYRPEEALLKKANLPLDKIEHFFRPPGQAVLDKKGREIICQTCQNSYYVNRTGVFEVLTISDELRKLIAAGAQAKQIKAQARGEKMRYLQEEGLLKVIDGTTSMAEVMRGLKTNGR